MCDDCSEPLRISLMGRDGVLHSSGFIAKVISSAILKNLVKLWPQLKQRNQITANLNCVGNVHVIVFVNLTTHLKPDPKN